MAQFIYLIAAMLGLMTVLMTSQRGIDRTRQMEMVNEVSTQLTNAAAEVLETVGRSYYDRFNFVERNNKYIGGGTSGPYAYCGRVKEGEQNARFTSQADIDAGTYRCASFGACPYIEGFDDLVPGTIASGNADTTVTRGDFTVNLEIDVQYIDPADYALVRPDNNPADGTPDRTFAKLVTVTAHTPDAYLGDDPSDFNAQLALSLARVFTYACPTSASDLPLPAAGETCASIGASPPACAVDNGA